LCRRLDRYSKETTVVNQIFGGFLRSQVVCLHCKHPSNTYDPFMDISLDIKVPLGFITASI
jgi:ubiquitin C-terminal hydrolase